MQQGVSVSKKALTNVAGSPRAAGRVHGHVNHNRSADNVFAGNTTHKTTVEGILTVVAHHKIAIGRNFVRALHVVTLGSAEGIIFVESPAVNPNSVVAGIERFPGQANDAFHDVLRLGWNN